MEAKFIKMAALTIALFVSFSFAVAQERPTTGVFQSDILLNGKKVYRNFPRGDISYRYWDENAVLINSFIDEDGFLFEDKMKDSIVFRKVTNTRLQNVRFWWFELILPKDSVCFVSKNITLRVGDPVDIMQIYFPNMWLQYEQGISNERNTEREIQLHTILWFHFFEDDEKYEHGLFQVYVQNGFITRITINFMTEGDMP